MTKREALQMKLEELLGSEQVYYQRPASYKMSYPAIVYKKDNVYLNSADDINYRMIRRYSVTVISKNPDNEVVERILMLPMTKYDRNYKKDNLYHEIVTIYW